MKFLDFRVEEGKKIRRFEYTVIDDATRIHALKIYERHTQLNAIDFVDYVNAKFPFRINIIRTYNSYESQGKFYLHMEVISVQRTFIKPRLPRLNSKVVRAHSADQQELYQLSTYADCPACQISRVESFLQTPPTSWALRRKNSV